MNYKLIALDMDGTLLNSVHEISDNTLSKIAAAFSIGKEIVLSTGRCLPELKKYFSLIPNLRYVICCNGALAYDVKEQKVIDSNPIPADKVAQILSAARDDEQVMVHFLSVDSIVEREKACKMAFYAMGRHQEMFDQVTTKIDDIFQYFEASPRSVEKINLYASTPAIQKYYSEKLIPCDLTIASAEGNSVELTAAGVSKASGLKMLCSSLHIPLSEVIAVGDSGNDIEMLQAAGLALAMENATDAVKAVSDVIVPDCDHDGCAFAIENYLLH